MDSTTLTILIAIAFLILAVITSWISARLGHHKRFTKEWWSNWIQGLSTELVGAAIATLLIGVVVGTVQKNEADEVLKRQLIAQMGSPNNDFAIEAVRQLRSLGWIENGFLQGAALWNANLEGAVLQLANLQGADLLFANLQDAFLSGANLESVVLQDANLRGAYLWNANLQGAKLYYAKFNESTILPDGTNWTPETDMSRFTDPNHPQFWRSDDPESPAYGGDNNP
ncbi:MAG: pentapeptide repeat-containing protein [Anaerolineae bacterium]|nr:pentapeptide repeat-containing protein [Anaerolineae bacterium]